MSGDRKAALRALAEACLQSAREDVISHVERLVNNAGSGRVMLVIDVKEFRNAWAQVYRQTRIAPGEDSFASVPQTVTLKQADFS